MLKLLGQLAIPKNQVQLDLVLTSKSLTQFKLQNNFAKWSKPKKQNKIKERKSAVALSDEKSGKIADASKPEQIKDPYAGLPHIRTFDKIYEAKQTQEQLDKLLEDQIYKIEGKRINIAKQREENGEVLEQALTPQEKEEFTYTNPNEFQRAARTQYRNKVDKQYFNAEEVVNQDLYEQIESVQEPGLQSRRSGVLGVKVGMTMTWDKWGQIIPLTVLQVDNCQVVQVKTEESDGYYGLQLGLGEKNLKKLSKPEIGHYLKNDIAPKIKLKEFKVTPENLLPVGFMFSAKHFTPGQYVDCSSVSAGKGFQGGMKRWNFSGQGASHGNSISHRALGSTGQNQDPGKVFKGKKMPGRMGGNRVTTKNLRVYKIDTERQLVYIKGAVSGKAGTVVEIKDAKQKTESNEKYLNHPTFIPQAGIEYANQVVMLPSLLDPIEENIHDNDVIE